jgi:transketolase
MMGMNIFAAKNVSRSEVSKPAFGETLVRLGEQNRDIVVCEADLMRASGTGAFMKRFPDRHFNFGVAEQNCMAVAAGLAVAGKTVFATTFANFASKRACDQVSISIAYNKANVKVCGTYAGLTSEKNGGTHISVEDIAIMRSMPNMRVVEPADTAELADMTRALAEYDGPVYFRHPKKFFRTIFNENYRFQFGKSVELMPGNDLTIIACGIMTAVALDAAEALALQGVRIRVVNMSSLKPLDAVAIIRAAHETGAILTVENHTIIGGLGSAVAEVLVEHRLNPAFMKVGIPDVFGQTADLEWLLTDCGLSCQNICDKAMAVIRQRDGGYFDAWRQ